MDYRRGNWNWIKLIIRNVGATGISLKLSGIFIINVFLLYTHD